MMIVERLVRKIFVTMELQTGFRTRIALFVRANALARTGAKLLSALNALRKAVAATTH